MVDLTGSHEVKAICPRCKGNGFIRMQAGCSPEINCVQCDAQGWVWLPAERCRTNVEGGIEPRWMKSGETI